MNAYTVKETAGVFAVVFIATGEEVDWADNRDEAEAVAAECDAHAMRQAKRATR